jgi:hypothetical protein
VVHFTICFERCDCQWACDSWDQWEVHNEIRSLNLWLHFVCWQWRNSTWMISLDWDEIQGFAHRRCRFQLRGSVEFKKSWFDLMIDESSWYHRDSLARVDQEVSSRPLV